METIRRPERKCSVLYRVLLEPEAVLPFLTVPRLCVCVCVCVCVCECVCVWIPHKARRVLVPQPGIKPVPPLVEVQS